MDNLTLIKELTAILEEIIDSEAIINKKTSNIHPENRSSAKNLLRYLILRSKDLRAYHGSLSDLGISSLRSAEGYVFSNLYSVVRNLNLIENTLFDLETNVEIIGYTKSQNLLQSHAKNLFLKENSEHHTDIMVTLPGDAAENLNLIKKMAQKGMQIARINLSHDNLSTWQKMIENIKEVESLLGQKIKIYMDLSGPKIRTSTISLRNKKGKLKDSIKVKVGEKILLSKPLKKSIENEGLRIKKSKEKIIEVRLTEVIDDAKIGDIVLFDDGMVRSIVVDKFDNQLKLKITQCYKHKIGSHKGINLPYTKLNLPALTKKDMKDLAFVCEHADIIGYSFVRTAKDVDILFKELDKHHASSLGVVFKIENEEAFENLPEILLKGMERQKIGVMIARGDLAVEIGFERISEVQNEILWICEAAHVPVIWATQVLESLAKTGIPTRAEISDAAVSAQAECVMLNKGEHILNAILVLKNILTRMEGHIIKKKNELRPLHIAEKFTRSMKSK
jgi:pyruvate kinase